MRASTLGKMEETRYSGGDGNSFSRAVAMARDSITHCGSDVEERGKRSTGMV